MSEILPAETNPNQSQTWLREMGHVASGRRFKFSAAIAAGAAALSLSPSLRTLSDIGWRWTESEVVAITEDLTDTAPVIDMREATPHQAYEYLSATFGMGTGLLKDSQEGLPAALWSQVSGLNAYDTLSLMPGQHRHEYRAAYRGLRTALDDFWNERAGGYYPDLALVHNEAYGVFDDDNVWAALALVRDFRQHHSKGDLARAQRIFNLEISQWNEKSGGIYWKVQLPGETNHDRAAVSNAPVVHLGVELYKHTHQAHYLRWAARIFDWSNENLKDPNTGMYNDHIAGDGTLNSAKWSYVQGVMAGAMAALSQVEPARYPLTDAVKFARESLQYFQNFNSSGVGEFRAIYFKNLLWTAQLSDSEQLLSETKAGLRNAVANLQRQPAHLLAAAGATELIALNELPFTQYHKLF